MPDPVPTTRTSADAGRHLSNETRSAISEVTAATTQGADLDGSVETAIWLASQTGVTERIDTRTLDGWIAELDRKISAQLDQILHHQKFQQIESAWRGLKFLVDRTDFGENIEIHVLQASDEELRRDFDESAGDLLRSGLYKKVGRAEYGQYGGQPYGMIVGNFHFSSRARDMKLLSDIAAVAAMTHAPFVSAASPEIIGLKDFKPLGNINSARELIRGADVASKWRAFRESEDSRYVGLTLPRFLLRVPYDPREIRDRNFHYLESVSGGHDDYLWGSTAFAFAARVTDSFANYRWYQNIIGPQAGGTVLDLPVHVFESGGVAKTKIPTEVLIPEALDVDLAAEGFIPLVMKKRHDEACFFSANSCQAPKFFGQSAEGKTAETNSRLGTQLPYIFIVSRLAHYLKVQQREAIGLSLSRDQLEAELTKWISQYVVRQDVVDELTKAKRPLRDAAVWVEDIAGEPGWYKVRLQVTPHIKYMGAFFELSLVGRVENTKK